jgi:hypothetical protein
MGGCQTQFQLETLLLASRILRGHLKESAITGYYSN